MKEKKVEKYLQTRYKRELERYLNRMVNFAKTQSRSRDDFDRYEAKMREKLESVEKRELNSAYYTQLEEFLDKIARLKESDGTMEEIASEILHEANKIRKSRRRKSYNRTQEKRYDEGDW